MDGVTSLPTNLHSVNMGSDRLTANQVGGQVQAFTAGATLKIGDAVYMASTGKVNKSTTASLYLAFVGFVVGGKSFNSEGQIAIPGDVNTIGATAALVDEVVHVQIDGNANAVVASALTLGAQVVPSGATAGRVVAAGATASNILGVVVTAGSATVPCIVKMTYGNTVAVGAGAVAITDATESTSTATGSIQTAGGVGIVKALWVGGLMNVAGVATLANATDSSSSTTGGTIISGGLGIAKKLYVGTTLNVAGIATLANATDASDYVTAGTVVTGGLAVAKKLYVQTAATFGSSITASGKIGYGAVGDVVVQGAGSGKATAFTLSKLTGEITTDNATLAADAIVSAVWTNTTIGATDVVIVNHVSGGTIGSYVFNVVCGAGSATLYIANRSAGNLSDAIVLRYVVLKGAVA